MRPQSQPLAWLRLHGQSPQRHINSTADPEVSITFSHAIPHDLNSIPTQWALIGSRVKFPFQRPSACVASHCCMHALTWASMATLITQPKPWCVIVTCPSLLINPSRWESSDLRYYRAIDIAVRSTLFRRLAQRYLDSPDRDRTQRPCDCAGGRSNQCVILPLRLAKPLDGWDCMATARYLCGGIVSSPLLPT